MTPEQTAWAEGHRDAMDSVERCDSPGPVARALIGTPSRMGAALVDWAGSVHADRAMIAAGLRVALEIVEREVDP